jgi:hypothetical protein
MVGATDWADLGRRCKAAGGRGSRKVRRLSVESFQDDLPEPPSSAFTDLNYNLTISITLTTLTI